MAAVASRPMTQRRPTNRVKGTARDNGKSMWSSMLESVATGKRMPEKTLLVLGGTSNTQTAFLQALVHDPNSRLPPSTVYHRHHHTNHNNAKRLPPIANRFALGYTYTDILDTPTDTDDILARLSQYLLSSSSLKPFSQLLPPLFTVKSVPDFAVTILLDWGEPWHWLRQLRDFIRTIKSAVESVDDDVRDALEENTREWKARRKGPKVEGSAASAAMREEYEAHLPVSLGPGEWEEPLGVPIVVVCQNAEKIEILEREYGWGDEEFDTVLIYLRTVLLKHGGGLIYTASAAPGSLGPLVKGTLDVRSLVRKIEVRHNVNERDKVCVPPNWDSWGKIRVLREEFDFERVSLGWSLDTQEPRRSAVSGDAAAQGAKKEEDDHDELPEGSAVAAYEALVRDPKASDDADDEEQATSNKPDDGLEVRCPSNQQFFAEQLQILEKYKAEDEAKAKSQRQASRPGKGGPAPMLSAKGDEQGRVSDHIGPVQFNMGGIQVDAEQMVQNLKDREASRSRKADGVGEERAASPFSPGAKDGDGEPSNEHLRSFFASLASRGGSSATSSPRGEGK